MKKKIPFSNPIHFQFGIRPAVLKSAIFMALMMGVIIVGMPFLGTNNAISLSMSCLVGVLMSLSKDLSMEPVRNSLVLLAANVGIVVTSFLGYGLFPEGSGGYAVMMTLMTLVTFFAIIFIFSSEEQQSSTYMPLLMNYSLMLYYPVYGRELLIRIIIYAAAAGLTMAANIALHKRKFEKKIGEAIGDLIRQMQELADLLQSGKADTAELTSRCTRIGKTLDALDARVSTKLWVRSWWHKNGVQLVRVLLILRYLNEVIQNSYIKNHREVTPELSEQIRQISDLLPRYIDHHFHEDELVRRIERLIVSLMPPEAAPYHSESELNAALDKKLEELISNEKTMDLQEQFWSKFDLHSFLLAIKVSVLAAAGTCVISLLRLPFGYYFPLYVGLTTQPFVELEYKAASKRIINTVYAVAILLLSFSFSDKLLVNLILVLAITLVGDMFFQFDFGTMFGTMLSVIFGMLGGRGDIYYLSLYRFVYIAAACLLVVLVDRMVFPKQLLFTLDRQIKASLAANTKIRRILTEKVGQCTAIYDLLLHKRKSNQRLRATNKYVANDQVNAYLAADEIWINRLTILNHKLLDNDCPSWDFREKNAIVLPDKTKQLHLLYLFQVILQEMEQAEALSQKAPLQNPALT